MRYASDFSFFSQKEGQEKPHPLYQISHPIRERNEKSRQNDCRQIVHNFKLCYTKNVQSKPHDQDRARNRHTHDNVLGKKGLHPLCQQSDRTLKNKHKSRREHHSQAHRNGKYNRRHKVERRFGIEQGVIAQKPAIERTN